MLFIATLSTPLGLLLVWQAWRAGRNKRRQQQLTYRIAGWMVLCVSLLPWMMAGGMDRGVALAVTFLLVLALVLVLSLGWQYGTKRHHRKNGKNKKQSIEKSTVRDETAKPLPLFARRSCTLLLAGPFSFLVALSLGVNVFVIARYLGWTLANQVAVTLLVVPFVWAVLSVWATYDTRLRYRSGVLSALFVLSAGSTLLGAL